MWPQVPCIVGSEKPSESCGEGSGANPDFALKCEADLVAPGVGACVPAKEVPSLK